jgi:hypothetical protein
MIRTSCRPAAAALGLVALALPAGADQAQCLTRAQADRAAVVLRGERQIRHYCAPCRDDGWREGEVSSVEVVDGDCGTEVRVNGVGIDLAYVYVQRKDTWVNLAKVVGVKVRDVPKRLPEELPALPE